MDTSGVNEVQATTEPTVAAEGNFVAENEAPQKTESKLDNDPNIVDRFAVIARADKRVRESQAKLKEEQKRIEEERTKYKDAVEFFEAFQKDPIAALENKNIKLEKLMERKISMLEDEENPAERRMRELEDRLNQEEKFRLDQQNQQLELKKQHFKNQIKSDLELKKDEFPLLATDDDAPDTVFEFIENFYNETGKILTKEEAFSKVHNYLVNELKSVLQLESVKKALGLSDKSLAESPQAKNKELHSTVTTTLDDSFTSSTSPDLTDDSEEARRAAAIKLAKSLFNAE